MKMRFEDGDEWGDWLVALPMHARPGVLIRTPDVGVYISSDRLEEVIAGLRDVNRAAVAEHEKRKEAGRG